MKKLLSIFLSLTMLLSITSGIDFSAYSATFPQYAKNLELNKAHTDFYSNDDPYFNEYNTNYRFHCYKFTIPISGAVKIYIEAKDFDYLDYKMKLYKSTDLSNWILYEKVNNVGYDTNTGVYYGSCDVNLSAGTYFIYTEYFLPSGFSGTYDITVKFNPSVTRPSYLNLSSRGQSSLALSWGGVGSANGYVLQMYNNGAWYDIAYPAGTSYTVGNLGAGSTNNFRVCAYINVDGVNYYSSFRYLTACTKPKTASLKSLKTYKKGHKIKVYWNKVGGSASGYQIYWAKDKNFKKVVAKKTVSGRSTTSYTGKNFTKGKKYYVKVRAYKTVNGKKYYGSWSKVKSIRVK